MIHIHSRDQLYIFNTIENGWLNRWRDIYMLPSFQSCLSWKFWLSQQQWTPSLNHTLGTELNRHLNKKQMLKSKNIYVLSHLTWKDKPVVWDKTNKVWTWECDWIERRKWWFFCSTSACGSHLLGEVGEVGASRSHFLDLQPKRWTFDPKRKQQKISHAINDDDFVLISNIFDHLFKKIELSNAFQWQKS